MTKRRTQGERRQIWFDSRGVGRSRELWSAGKDVVVGVLGREADFGYPIHISVGKGRCTGRRCVAACGDEMSRRRRSQIDDAKEDDVELESGIVGLLCRRRRCK
ncbi:hypothetical protein U1Q18_016096 [Sarracenia purpurea var. burkii]